MKKWISNLFNSFPVHLFATQLYKNLSFTFLWLLLIFLINGSIGHKYGFSFLFLAPEYHGRVNFTSFFILGLAFGSLFITWNLTMYLLNARVYPFLATLSKPFTKFCYNNFITPLIFLIVYLCSLIPFFLTKDLLNTGQIWANLLGFFSGATTTVIIIGLYLNFTNKDILNFIRFLSNIPPNLMEGPAPGRYVEMDFNRRNSLGNLSFYVSPFFKLRRVRSTAHYDKSLIDNIFAQNHKNALTIQLFIMFLVVMLGSLSQDPIFRIPAGASIFLITGIIMSISGFVTYYFGKWRLLIFFLLLYSINQVTGMVYWDQRSKAFGLNYKSELKAHTEESLLEMIDFENIEKDKVEMIHILENWKSKQPTEKPPLVLLCVSGGGLKNALWTVNVLSELDAVLPQPILDYSFMISGASGGLIGASYYRSQYHQKINNQPVSETPKKDVSKDLLNSIAFTLISNDFFFPWSSFSYNGIKYRRGRGYIFEHQLNENVNGLFDVPISHFKEAEEQAAIPLIWFSPVEVTNGRKILISNQHLSFMTTVKGNYEDVSKVDGICFNRYFEQQGADSLRFSSAVRMSATFPVILPSVTLPSNPPMEVVDAGLRDNYGISIATRFIKNFSGWLKENTSKVIIIKVLDEEQEKFVVNYDQKGILESSLKPFELAGKVMLFQQFSNDYLLDIADATLNENQLQVFDFIYRPSILAHKASISFHLTEEERRDINQAWKKPKNQVEFQRLKNILGIK